jgi:hypothetical protein
MRNQDELGALPTELGGIYRACYQAGQISGWEAGYRQGYQAGFGDGRRQGDAGSTATAAAVENTSGKPVSAMRAGTPKARLFGLPCIKCKRFLYNDEERCPYCRTPRQQARSRHPQPASDLGEVYKRERVADFTSLSDSR